LGRAGCPRGAPQHSRVVAVPLRPAPQVGEQREGSPGGDEDRHLDAEGEELVLLQRVHPHLGERRARAGTRSAAAEPPGCNALGARGSSGGRGRVGHLLLLPGERPVRFGHQRLQRRDVVVAQINLGQGQHVRGRKGGPEAATTPAGQHPPCCFGPRARRAAPRSVCRRRRIFCGKGRISLPVGHKAPTDCPRSPVPSPPLLPPPSLRPACFLHSPVQPNFFPGAGFSVPPLSFLRNGKST